MKKLIVTLFLLCATTLALALPSPKDIAAAVEAGQFLQAEAMLREVIKEKPTSAKAHFQLGEVLAREHRLADARQSLLEAQRLDPSLKFAKDPRHFQDLLAKVEAGGASAPTATASPSASTAPAVSRPQLERTAPAAPAQASSGFPWGYVVAGGGILLLAWFVFGRAMAARTPSLATAGGMGGSYGGQGGYGAPPAGGSGIGGAVLGGVAGMAAGYGLAKLLERNEEHGSSSAAGTGGAYVPLDGGSAAGQSSSNDWGAFDSGSGDSWDSDSGSGGSSGSDDW